MDIQCSGCRLVKPPENFGLRGLRYKTCVQCRERQSYYREKYKVEAVQKQWYDKHKRAIPEGESYGIYGTDKYGIRQIIHVLNNSR